MKCFETVHPDWLPVIQQAMAYMDNDYLKMLTMNDHWLPGAANLFSAFSESPYSMRYILLGESPYPRAQSANGYAFWDAAVDDLWSEKGLNRLVNKATSLRNLIKMLLVARGDLSDDVSQTAIATLSKQNLWQTNHQLFRGFLNKGFLLLNASLVFEVGKIRLHALYWRPFIEHILRSISHSYTLLLFGKISGQITLPRAIPTVMAEHPYNISFIHNPLVIEWFKPLDLLKADDGKC